MLIDHWYFLANVCTVDGDEMCCCVVAWRFATRRWWHITGVLIVAPQDATTGRFVCEAPHREPSPVSKPLPALFLLAIGQTTIFSCPKWIEHCVLGAFILPYGLISAPDTFLFRTPTATRSRRCLCTCHSPPCGKARVRARYAPWEIPEKVSKLISAQSPEHVRIFKTVAPCTLKQSSTHWWLFYSNLKSNI